MKAKNEFRSHLLTGRARRAVALLSLIALLSSTFLAGASAQQKQKTQMQRLSEEQRILHVLNRFGFGARPDDVERVRAMGLENYLRQQLNPSAIDDAPAEAKVARLSTLSMTTAELYAKYPNPGQLLRQLQREGKLPEDLAQLRDNRKGGTPPATAAPDAKDDGAMTDERGAMSDSAKDAGAPQAGMTNDDRQAYRRAIRDYYIQNNLRPPGQIMQELQASRIIRAVYSERQLQEVMVDFWENHFNVFANKGADRWLLVSYDRDTVRPHTLGKFKDLLVATAESPAMLFYLDNFQSVSPNAQQGGAGQLRRRRMQRDGGLFGSLLGGRRRNPNQELRRQHQRPPDGANQPAQQQRQKRGINENYARELMELHTLGVDGGYTQKDVQEVARCFTGWTIFAPRGGGMRQMSAEMAQNAGRFYFNPRLHDDGEKIVLGHKIPAGGGVNDGLMVLDILAHHPATARFLATKLARRFVMDEPPPALVERISAAYLKSDGDIRETLMAIFTSPEFNSTESYRAKIKTPFELAVSAVRTLGGETNGSPAFHQWIARMGEPLYGYQPPTGYPDTAEDWVNTGALLERLNFGLALANNRIPGTRVDLARFTKDGGGDASVNKEQILDRFLDVIVQGDVSPNTKRTLLRQLDEPLPAKPAAQTTQAQMTGADDEMAAPPRRRQLARADAGNVNSEVVKIVGLILGSPEFQRQ